MHLALSVVFRVSVSNQHHRGTHALLESGLYLSLFPSIYLYLHLYRSHAPGSARCTRCIRVAPAPPRRARAA